MNRIKTIIALLLVFNAAFAQQTKPPYRDDIQAFKKQDSINMPAKKQILFAGSSSFTKWTDVQDYFPSYKILNRGFGGSTLADVIRYADDVIFKYEPKQIIIYCGENDFAANDSVTVDTVVSRFKQLFAMIREHYKKVPVAYISIKPSPSRQSLVPKIMEANKQLKKYLHKKRKAIFIDVYHAMLNTDGTPIKEIFIEDNLHINAKGYAIWQKIIEPYLKK